MISQLHLDHVDWMRHVCLCYPPSACHATSPRSSPERAFIGEAICCFYYYYFRRLILTFWRTFFQPQAGRSISLGTLEERMRGLMPNSNVRVLHQFDPLGGRGNFMDDAMAATATGV